MAFGNRAQEIKLERGSYYEDVSNNRLGGKKRRVVQRLEINASVNRLSGVVEVLANRHFNLRASFLGNSEQRTKPFVDRGAVIHLDQRFKVCVFHSAGMVSPRD